MNINEREKQIPESLKNYKDFSEKGFITTFLII